MIRINIISILFVFFLMPNVLFSNEIIHTTAELSQERSHFTAAVVDGRILFAGGYNYPLAQRFSIIDIYDPTAEMGSQWTTSNLSLARQGLSGVSTDVKAYFAGGVSAPGVYTNIIDIYDSTATIGQEWSTAALSLARITMGSASTNKKVFFAGGVYYTGSGWAQTDRVDIYNEETGGWSTDSLSANRQDVAGAAVGNKVIFAGGMHVIGYLNAPFLDTVDIYDTKTDQWSTAQLSTPRIIGAAATVGNKAIFAGGVWQHPSKPWVGGLYYPQDRVDIYDADTNTWSTATLSEARWNMASAVVGKKVFFAGGVIDPGIVSSIYSDKVDIYDSETDTWSVMTLSEPRSAMAGASIGNQAVFAGGVYDSSGTTSNSKKVDIFYVFTEIINGCN